VHPWHCLCIAPKTIQSIVRDRICKLKLPNKSAVNELRFSQRNNERNRRDGPTQKQERWGRIHVTTPHPSSLQFHVTIIRGREFLHHRKQRRNLSMARSFPRYLCNIKKPDFLVRAQDARPGTIQPEFLIRYPMPGHCITANGLT
jgi:hypothetical protein